LIEFAHQLQRGKSYRVDPGGEGFVLLPQSLGDLAQAGQAPEYGKRRIDIRVREGAPRPGAG
jgi:hypothetical protein